MPWIAVAGICMGGGFVQAADGPPSADRALPAGEAAAPTAETADVMTVEAACPVPACPKTVKRWRNETEMRDVECTEWTTEERIRSYTVKKRVPRTEQRTRTYTVMVPEQRTKTVEYTVNTMVPETQTEEYQVCVPFTEKVEKMYTVMVPVKEEKTSTYTVRVPYTEAVEETYTVRVPYTEELTGVRTVIKRVPVKTTQTVTCRGGHWENEFKEISTNGKYDADGNPCCPKTVRFC